MQDELIYVHNVSGAEYHVPPKSLNPVDSDTAEVFEVDEIRVFKHREVDLNQELANSIKIGKLKQLTSEQADNYIVQKQEKINQEFELKKNNLLKETILEAYEEDEILLENYNIEFNELLNAFYKFDDENKNSLKIEEVYNLLDAEDKDLINANLETKIEELKRNKPLIMINRFGKKYDVNKEYHYLPEFYKYNSSYFINQLINKIENVDKEAKPKNILKKIYYKLLNKKPKLTIGQKVKKYIEPEFYTLNSNIFQSIVESNNLIFKEGTTLLEKLKTVKKIAESH